MTVISRLDGLGHKAVDRVSRQGSFDRELHQAGLVAHDVLGSGPATTSWLRQSASALRASSGPKPERQHAGLAGLDCRRTLTTPDVR